MAHLINKDALVAEIEKRLKYRIESLKAMDNGTYWKEEQSENEFNKLLTGCAFNAAKNELFELKCFLDILEVKEVDLDEEIKSYFKGFGKFPSVGIDDCIDIAKYFFELGLQTHK